MTTETRVLELSSEQVATLHTACTRAMAELNRVCKKASKGKDWELYEVAKRRFWEISALGDIASDFLK